MSCIMSNEEVHSVTCVCLPTCLYRCNTVFPLSMINHPFFLPLKDWSIKTLLGTLFFFLRVWDSRSLHVTTYLRFEKLTNIIHDLFFFATYFFSK